MLVCVCNGISDRDIDNALKEGASSFSDMRKSLGLGACCGQCASFAKDMISDKIAEAQTSSNYALAYEIRV